MKKLNDEIVHFLQNQGCLIVSTIGRDGYPHNSCKGVVEITHTGKVYLLDVYKAKTYENLRSNPLISVTAIDEHRFIGYCLKGRATILTEDNMTPRLFKAWEERITSRLTRRLLRNLREEKGHPRHPEALLPNPEYVIEMDVEEIVDLTPHHLK